MKKRTVLYITFFLGLFLWGCYPDGPDYTEDLDIVITQHNDEYDFMAKTTYALPTKIVKITGNLQEGDSPEFIPDATAVQILAQIDKNMLALGWQKVGVSANPDVLLAVASMETTTVFYYYDYWYWWYGGYYPYYPYYPPVYAGSYTAGTLLFTMTDPKELNANGYPVKQWTGILNGILDSKYNPARVNPLIDKAFEQSPYLLTK
jgi:hypothetical protein